MLARRAATDLCGEWSLPDAAFFWESAQIFPRRSSENPCDCWVALAGGACLASRCDYVAARFDPDEALLNFSPCAQPRAGSPWRLLWPEETEREGLRPLLVKPDGVEHAARNGFFNRGAWTRPLEAIRWLRANCQGGLQILELTAPGLDAALLPAPPRR